MNVKLRDEDRQAVDLLLDRASTARNGGGQTQVVAMHAGVSSEHLAAVEKVLSLLDAVPASEPAQDLLQRTLARIDANYDTQLRGQQGPSLIDLTRPVV